MSKNSDKIREIQAINEILLEQILDNVAIADTDDELEDGDVLTFIKYLDDDCAYHFTSGKEYVVFKSDYEQRFIRDDDGDALLISEWRLSLYLFAKDVKR